MTKTWWRNKQNQEGEQRHGVEGSLQMQAVLGFALLTGPHLIKLKYSKKTPV